MKISFLGAGKMGGAIIESLIKSKAAKASDICAHDVSAARVAELVKRFKIKGAANACEAVNGADVVFLAVKPQDLGALLASVKTVAPLFVSIAAGKKTAWMESTLPPKARVVRVMPNLAVSVGQGMSGFCLGKNAKKFDAKTAQKLLSCTGKAIEFPEEQLDAVTALSGSGPAFCAYFLQAMSDAGAALGLDAECARESALQTLLGTAMVLAKSGQATDSFIKDVTSAKGTTAAGLEVLEKSALRSTVKKTLAAAARRSKELSL